MLKLFAKSNALQTARRLATTVRPIAEGQDSDHGAAALIQLLKNNPRMSKELFQSTVKQYMNHHYFGEMSDIGRKQTLDALIAQGSSERVADALAIIDIPVDNDLLQQTHISPAILDVLQQYQSTSDANSNNGMSQGRR